MSMRSELESGSRAFRMCFLNAFSQRFRCRETFNIGARREILGAYLEDAACASLKS